ncbi:hypothetical protein [Pseudomonas sp. BP01]|uniref:hypothetical protein n=1 Tax=Pseudomonas sp. BP01 TaxID=2976152 RepID=UPI001FAA98BC|nr:hypothetical protein [Pseudomonas sp. BP01]
MTTPTPGQSAPEGGRLLVRHFFWIVAVFALVVSICSFLIKPLAGIAAFCTFVGLLLPAWQLTMKSSVYAGKFKDLSKADKISLSFALVGMFLTALGYYVGLSALFTSC